MNRLWALGCLLCVWAIPARAETCPEMQVRDPSTGMCQGLAMAGMPMRMLMLHGNIFGVQTWSQGPRGRNAFAAPNMIMADVGTSLGDRQYINLDLMGTAERWTFPDAGYPLYLQIGEENSKGVPYLDAQHPHSSPLMGLTLSDTISLGGERNYLKLFFAPRGQSTDGPLAFMHRETSAYNPDAPLGHHIGQDAGHISSTVIGASFKWQAWQLEASTFYGAEPKPQSVDLPLGKPDSFALRLVGAVSPQWTAYLSYAHVHHPEQDDDADIDRYSTSLYTTLVVCEGWTFKNSLIAGVINHYDATASLASVTEEFLFMGDKPRLWGRIEALQRTAAELEVSTDTHPRWVGALTLGYGHRLHTFGDSELDIGASVTTDFLPKDFKPAYGGNPVLGRIYLQLDGMKMWDF